MAMLVSIANASVATALGGSIAVALTAPHILITPPTELFAGRISPRDGQARVLRPVTPLFDEMQSTSVVLNVQ
jgi:hypothetical protein